ncbi:MAG: trigger factor [Flavobacteriales bacterium]|nr:trigger factor [Flavobacteriales bacterium]|tara:strand:+ start:158 stop:1510 length:1353 start_codon:yes stop_codon:yes gene_type:complete
MKITQENTNNLQAELKVVVSPEDYQEKVDKVLKDYRKNAEIPGFRKGKAPMGMIVKKYRTPVLVDEVNKMLQSELYKYISDEKVKVLGSPMPVKDQKVDWENDTIFNFKYEIGLSPDFDVKISKKDKLTYYKIEADTKIVDTYANDIAKRYGKMSNPKVSSEGDLVFCEIVQLDLDGNLMQNGVKNEATVSMDFITDKKIKQKFIGVKKKDSFKVNVKKAFTNHTDLSAMLNISSEELQDLSSEEFQFTVKNVSKLEPAKMNKELFEKVYGKDSVKTVKEFKAKIKEEAERSYTTESDRMLKNDVVNYLLDKVKFDMPDDFLKKWLVHTSEQSVNLEQIESEYDMYSKSLRWQLIENSILEIFEIKVDSKEVESHTKSLITMQMNQYGQPAPEDDKMNEIVANILAKEDERKKIYDQLYDIKTLEVYKEKFKLIEKAIAYEDFVKLASKK